MPLRCSANIGFLFPDLPLEAALDRALSHGFHTVELIDPYSVPLEDLDRALRRRSQRVDLFNFPMGDFRGGERGYAGDPARRDRFRADVERAVPIAGRLGARKVNVLAGTRLHSVAEEDQRTCLVENLALAADRFRETGARVLVELLNPVETPGYLLSTVAAVREVLEELGGRVAFQLDIYHLQRAQGELIPTIEAMAGTTGHVQVADAPGRGEPGTGEINVPRVLAAMAASGYADVVGLEYRPSGASVDPFAWMEACGLERA